jgi:hypothetical protein
MSPYSYVAAARRIEKKHVNGTVMAGAKAAVRLVRDNLRPIPS